MKLKKKLFHPDYDNYKLLANLKLQSESISDFNNNIKSGLKHPFTKHVITANPFPESYSDIKKARQVPITKNLAGELGWILHSILKYKDKIKWFLQLKKEFDSSLLRGEYEQAGKLLNKVENKVGISLWSIENTFIIKELWKGSEANWAFLSDISDKIDNALILLMTECYSKRAESKISYSRYSDFIQSKIEGLNNEALAEYFYFRLNYPAFKNYSHFYLFLSIESGFPLIDRYLLLVNILSEGLRNSKDEYLDIFDEAISNLSDFNRDEQLVQLRTLLNGNFEVLTDTKDFIQLCDKYSEGKFEESLKHSVQLISTYPTALEPYEVYIKSLIELEHDFKETGVSSLVDEVLENLYTVISRGSKFSESVSNLLKISTIYQNTSWGKQIHGLTNKYTSRTNKSSDNSYLFTINSKFNNPRILSFLDSDIYSSYKKEFEKSYSSPLCYQINNWIVKGDSNSFDANKRINSQRKFIYQGRALEKAENFEGIINHFENFKNSYQLTKIEEEERVRQLYKAYIQTNSLSKALLLFVNNYLDNNQLTNRLSSESLLNKVQKNNQNDLNELIELPIFYQIASTPSYNQYVAYDNFLSSHGLTKPSALYEEINIADSKLIYFFDKVCSVDLMQYSIVFDGQDEVESERRKLLRILLKIDSVNEEKYIKEIAELTQTENVREAIREVNKGRIAVNIPQLKNNESSNIEEGFSRYQELSKYSENNKEAKGLDVSTETIKGYIDNLIEEKKQDPEGITNDPAYISFKAMFLDLRDKFLLSKEYGLDGYLSTRIRHGTLENHIRSVFENHNLISERDSQGEYQGIEYWTEVGPINLDKHLSNLQEDLKRFSKRIDEKIRYITQELIQIYTEKHNSKPNALFNYNFTQDYLWVAFQSVKDNINDQDEFIDFVFGELQTHTEQRLKEVRNQFKGDIKQSFIEELDQLNESIDNSLGNKSYPELKTAILNSRTEINDELDRISEWFYLSNPSTNLISDVMTTLRTGVEITNSIFPNRQIEPNYNNVDNIPIIGATHVIYITRILLDNIIKHSGLQSEYINVEISTEIVQRKLLRLSFSNELADSIDLQKLDDTLMKVKEKWIDKSNFEKTNVEGGSGFDKIRRILAFDLRGKKYGFDYKIDGNKVKIIVDVDIDIKRKEL